MNEEKRTGPGRPEGSKETPHNLLNRELRATIKAAGQIRELVETQIDTIAKVLHNTKDIPISTQMEMLERLGQLAQSLIRNAEILAKYLMDKRVRNTEDSGDDTAKPTTSSTALRNLLK